MSLAPCLAGFEHIRRSYCDKDERVIARIVAGEFYVTRAQEVISTLLGSCIAACIWDPAVQIGGMNHFLLPDHDESSRSARYGAFAMEHLVNRILMAGGQRDRLSVKLFGGGDVMNGSRGIGRRNIEFAREYVRKEGFRLVGEDVGSHFSRVVRFFPDVGRARVRKTPIAAKLVIAEVAACERQSSANTSGGVELF